MAEGKDIAWEQYAYIGVALVGGILIGTFVVPIVVKKLKGNKKTTAKTAETTKK